MDQIPFLHLQKIQSFGSSNHLDTKKIYRCQNLNHQTENNGFNILLYTLDYTCNGRNNILKLFAQGWETYQDLDTPNSYSYLLPHLILLTHSLSKQNL